MQGAQQWTLALPGEGTIITVRSEGSLGMNMDNFFTFVHRKMMIFLVTVLYVFGKLGDIVITVNQRW